MKVLPSFQRHIYLREFELRSDLPMLTLVEQYALTEASYVLIRLLQTFEDIENRDPNLHFIEDLRLTLACHGGANVSLTRANSKR